ncbi:hypothetical protein B6D60_04620 [candidate division KSB1 bacterium 4484_87]|nr:MAG: hypothetical protein B6D60_04620 [candidate division KSB1 bacterium 4484_87]
MAFEEIIGQKRVLSILTHGVESGRLPHALLFHGPEGVGKLAVALAMAKVQFCQQDTLYCNNCRDCQRVTHLSHPDLKIIFPAKKNYEIEYAKNIIDSIARDPYNYLKSWHNERILIGMIREEIKRWVSMKSFEKGGRVIILIDAHRFKEEAANSLLKIIEEPPEGVRIFLLTSRPDLILPTIISRCQQIRFDPIPWQDVKKALIEREKITEDKAGAVARMSFGSYRRALELLGEDISEKKDLMLDVLRKALLSDLDILTFTEDLVSGQDTLRIIEILELMSVWFRDAMIMEKLNFETDIDEKLIFSDRKETLEKFINSFEPINYEKILNQIGTAITMINSNAAVNLVILQLIYELKGQLRRKTNV